MFKGLTDRAQRVINILAQEEAKKLSHDKLLPEHILLGLIRGGEGVAVRALLNLGIDFNTFREEMVTNTKKTGGITLLGDVPPSLRSQRVLELSADAARNMGHIYIGTEHLLQGLLREGDSVILSAFEKQGIKISNVKEEIKRVIETSKKEVKKKVEKGKEDKKPNLFFHTVMNGKLTEVKRLIDEGVDVNAQYKKGRTGLLLASVFGYIEVARLLIENAADVNAQDDEGISALMIVSFAVLKLKSLVILGKTSDSNGTPAK